MIKKLFLVGFMFISACNTVVMAIPTKKKVAAILVGTTLSALSGIELAIMHNSGMKEAENEALFDYIKGQIKENPTKPVALDSDILNGEQTWSFEETENVVEISKNPRRDVLTKQDPLIINQPTAHEHRSDFILYDDHTLHPYTDMAVNREVAPFNVAKKNITVDELTRLSSGDQRSFCFRDLNLALNHVFNETIFDQNTRIMLNKKMLFDSGNKPILVLFENNVTVPDYEYDNESIYGLKKDFDFYQGNNKWGVCLMRIRDEMHDFYSKKMWLLRRFKTVQQYFKNKK